jgi:hypothetical protein
VIENMDGQDRAVNVVIENAEEQDDDEVTVDGIYPDDDDEDDDDQQPKRPQRTRLDYAAMSRGLGRW